MELSELLRKIKSLEQRLLSSEKEIERLRFENAALHEELSKYKVTKNSRNSSIPPSKDISRPMPNQSLREPSDKPLGGQPGHKGNTLKMVGNPDTIVDLIPDYCGDCGSSLAMVDKELTSCRQQIDLPLVTPLYTEYRSYSKSCTCGKTTQGSFPSSVESPISYGPGIESLVSYFHARQYLPFARMQELFTDVFNVNISQGGIACLLQRFTSKTTPIYQIIKDQVSQSKIVGSDETSVAVNGKKHWVWVWQTPKASYIVLSPNRGSATIEKHFPQGFPNSVLASDGWKAQLNTNALAHQSCIAHLLRRLNYLNQKYKPSTWGCDFQQLLYDAINLKKQQGFNAKTYQQKTATIIQSMEHLLEHPPDKNLKELYSFYKRMCRERQYLFVFLYIKDLPPDNNASERAIRNIKVKQKISGQFKNQDTAQNFAMIRSVIDTTIKNGRNVLNALNLIAKNEFDLSY